MKGGVKKPRMLQTHLYAHKVIPPHAQRALWTPLPAPGLRVLHAGHLHLQPAALSGLLHHHEGKRGSGGPPARSPGDLPTQDPQRRASASHPQLRSSEKLLPIPLFCIVATAGMWAASLYFFFQNLSSWEVRERFSLQRNCSPSISPFGPSCLPLSTCLWLSVFEMKAFSRTGGVSYPRINGMPSSGSGQRLVSVRALSTWQN